MERNYFTILFFIRKTRLLKNGEAPICLRVTVNGQRAEIQIKRSVELTNWDAQKECAIDRTSTSREINAYLEVVRTKIQSIHRKLELDNNPITASIIMRRYNGEGDNPKMLLEVFKEHNKKCRDLLGKEYVLGSVLRYERTATYLGEFMKSHYKITDTPLKNITNEFIRGFEHFVKVMKNCDKNTATKYLTILKRITKIALLNRWIDVDPFLGIKFSHTKSNREFLSEQELISIMQKRITIERLEVVRDVFVFCSFTGLAFTDVKHLKPSHIHIDNNGNKWIFKTREKTDNMCHIPLLDIPLLLIEKYRYHSDCIKNECVLPVYSNQRMNSYLKEIADICGIQKNLSTHIARHTFACIALQNKVSMESIAKMLGHSDISTTKIYAKIQDRTIVEEVQFLKRRFSLGNSLYEDSREG